MASWLDEIIGPGTSTTIDRVQDLNRVVNDIDKFKRQAKIVGIVYAVLFAYVVYKVSKIK